MDPSNKQDDSLYTSPAFDPTLAPAAPPSPALPDLNAVKPDLVTPKLEGEKVPNYNFLSLGESVDPNNGKATTPDVKPMEAPTSSPVPPIPPEHTFQDTKSQEPSILNTNNPQDDESNSEYDRLIQKIETDADLTPEEKQTVKDNISYRLYNFSLALVALLHEKGVTPDKINKLADSCLGSPNPDIMVTMVKEEILGIKKNLFYY